MSSTAKLLTGLAKLFSDPNMTDQDLDDLLEEIEKEEADAGLPPQDQRAEGEAQVLALLAKQSSETTHKELEFYLNKHFGSIKVAKLVARHPSLSEHVMRSFYYFLPDDVVLNPSYETATQAENWDHNLKTSKPYKALPSTWSRASISGGSISATTPWKFKVDYWLLHGAAADKRYIVGIEALSEAFITPFLKDKSAHIRKAIACRSNLSSEFAQLIAKDKAKTVRQALAENSNCPPDVLTILTTDSEPSVVGVALKNASCPEEAIQVARLAAAARPKAIAKPVKDLSNADLIALLGDSSTDCSVLEELLLFEDAFIAAGVALHNQCSSELLTRLAKSGSDFIKLSVAFNPHTPTDVLQNLLDAKGSALHIGLASNPSLTEEQQLQLVEISSESNRLVLADTTDSYAVWNALRDSKSPLKSGKKSSAKTWRECLEIALDPNGKGLYALQRGAKTKYLFVAKIIARHPKCPDSLKSNYAFYLFDSLAQNPSIALELLENPNAIKPEEYADWKVDQWLSDGAAPGHVAKYYLFSDDIKRRRKAVNGWAASIADLQPQVFVDDIHLKKRLAEANRNTRFMFEILARDSKSSIRELVAKNKKCPSEVLAVLAIDKVASVKVAAKQNKKFKASLLDSKDVSNVVEEFKNKGPKRNRMRMADESKKLSLLRDLAGDKVSDVRLSVASNKRTPLDVLTNFVQDESAEIRRLVAWHRNSSVELIKSLFPDEDENVRYAAFVSVVNRTAVSLETDSEKSDSYDYHNNKYDEAIIAQFYADPSERIRQFVAEHTENVDIQTEYADEQNQKVCERLAKSRHLNLDVAHKLIDAGDSSVVKGLVKNTKNKEVFLRIAQCNPAMAQYLNGNYHLIYQEDVQAILVSHSDPEVRKACASYVKDPALIQLLASDPQRSVRHELCYNGGLRKQHVETLLSNPDAKILESLYSDKMQKIIAGFAGQLVANDDVEVRAYVAEYLKLDAKLQAKLCDDESDKVRFALAQNWVEDGVSNETLEKLKQDPNKSVRRAANRENY